VFEAGETFVQLQDVDVAAPQEAELHRVLTGPGGVTDAVMAGAALSVIAFTPSPLWQRVRLLPSWQVVKPALAPACVACPVLFALLVVSSLTGTDQGLAKRALVTSCVVWVGALAVTLLLVSRKPRPPVP
jgi:hypothetical protein